MRFLCAEANAPAALVHCLLPIRRAPPRHNIAVRILRSALPIVNGCGLVSQLRAEFLGLTFEQRRAIRAIAIGKIGTLKADVLETLMRRDLLKYDGQSLVLTAGGCAAVSGA